MTNIVMMLLMVSGKRLKLTFKVVGLFFISPHSLYLISLLSPSDWRHICHCVWSDPLPDLHQSRTSHELQSDHTEPRAADGQNHGGHHQPGGHPHTGRGVRRRGAMAHSAR